VRDAVARVAIVVADVATAAVDSVRAVAVEGEGAVGSVVPDQRVACRARAAAGRGSAARAAVARAVVVSVVAMAAADWAAADWEGEKVVEATDWAVVATAAAERGMSRVCTGRVHTCHRLLHLPSWPCHRAL